MDISKFINDMTAFYQAHPLIAIAGGLLLIYLIYRKPKFFLSIIFLGLLLAWVIHFIISAGSSGVSHKGKLIEQGEKVLQKE